MTQFIDWHNCYKGGWKNEIVPDAFQHPAKYSRKLIARIYDHLIDERLIERGARVVDPFGGVALGALDAMRCGLDWTGVELEAKFHALGNANISLWNARYASLPRWGTARLLNGDSRNLAQLVRAAEFAVSSPPYAEAITYQQPGAGGEGNELMRAGYSVSEAVSSPPYAEAITYQQPGAGGEGNELMRAGYSVSEIAEMRRNNDPRILATRRTAGYSRDTNNLGNMPAGDFAAAISSPPYEEARIGETSGAANVGHGANYGSTDGQLGSMTGGDFNAAVSSPPYEHESYGGGISKSFAEWRAMNGRANDKPGVMGFENGYGSTDGQLGGAGHETFWLASRQIVSQVHSILAPRGIAVWVVKDFVRNRERVPFCAQWRELCAAVGFEHLYTARARLVENNGTQLAHDGNHKNHITERKSFFRRLNEKNGGPRIDWEEIIFMVKP